MYSYLYLHLFIIKVYWQAHCNYFKFLLLISSVTALALFSEAQFEVVGNRGVGVGSDGFESIFLCPLDESLRSCGQLLFHRLWHLHQPFSVFTQADGIWRLSRTEGKNKITHIHFTCRNIKEYSQKCSFFESCSTPYLRHISQLLNNKPKMFLFSLTYSDLIPYLMVQN